MVKKNVLFITFMFLLVGCATKTPVTPSGEPQPLLPPVSATQEAVGSKDIVSVTVEIPDDSPQLVNIKDEEMKKYVLEKGVIFAKTDFQGVLNTNYVKLLFRNLEHPEHTFQLHVGDKSTQTGFPWEVKVVKPGYFFVELPAGKYKIASISIPVGSTMATEESEIYVEVFEDQIAYVGTLQLIGTKERIKLGGVPLIKPGFEYTAEIVDEREEGISIFEQRYPEVTSKVSVHLMQIKPTEQPSVKPAEPMTKSIAESLP